jgi:hypothetical protein
VFRFCGCSYTDLFCGWLRIVKAGALFPHCKNYLGSAGIARNTPSSTGMVCVKDVEVLPSAKAICLASPLSAGPAGFAEFAGASPGCNEMRVVFGVQLLAPKQVSRKKTCRNPLFGEALASAALAELAV